MTEECPSESRSAGSGSELGAPWTRSRAAAGAVVSRHRARVPSASWPSTAPPRVCRTTDQPIW